MARLPGALACVLALLAGGPARAQKPTVAVLYFDYDRDDELAQLRKGLAQMLISDLSAHDGVAVVERARLQEVLDELQLGQSKKVDPEQAAKVGKLLSARFLVLGGYFQALGQLQLTARVVEVETSKTVAGLQARGRPDDFFALEQQLSEALAKALRERLPALAARDGGGQAKAAPRKPAKLKLDAAVRYGRALDALDRKDRAAAKQELEAVVKQQPDFELATLDLAALVK